MSGGLTAVIDGQLGEVELAGGRHNLIALAQTIRCVAPASPHVERLDPLPEGASGKALALLKVSTSDGKVVLAVDTASDQLAVSGAPQWLKILADNIANFAAEADPTSHLHLEYFPGHFYIDEGSAALVIAID